VKYISEAFELVGLVIAGVVGFIGAAVAGVLMVLFLSVMWVIGLPIVIKVGDQQRKYRWFRRV